MNDSKIRYASVEKPWMKHYGEFSKGKQIPHCTMYREIRESCERNKAYDAIAFDYYGKKTDYRQMLLEVDQYAAAFAELGVREGEIVTLISVCLPETICQMYALNKIGAVCSFVDPRTDASNIRKYIKKAKSRVVVTLEMNYHAISEMMNEPGIDYVIGQTPATDLTAVKGMMYKLKGKRYHVPYDGKRILSDRELFQMGAGKSADEVKYKQDMPAIIVPTGGTTGPPKNVVLTNDNMNALAANFSVTIPVSTRSKESNQTFLNFLPIASSYGIAVGVHMAISMNLKDYLIPRFNTDEFDKLLIKYKPNHIIGTPILYEQLISSQLPAHSDLGFISTMASGGDTASEYLEDKLDIFRLSHGIKYPIAQGYGMSESSSAASFGFQNIHRKGSAGVPCYFTTIAAFEPGTSKELPIGETGELCITGPTVMKEYLGDPEETKNVLRKHDDGKVWLHSGDLGYIDEDGFVFIAGRIKRMIIRTDGHKVQPLQIEKVVISHPDVAKCCVIPVKDREHIQGEQPLICVELTKGVNGRNGITDERNNQVRITKEILKICEENLEARGQPVGVLYVDRIPVTGSAKNDYRKLTELYGNYDYTMKK